ncbi:MAG: glycoside hydrolase, partial [Planctomycetes bacterium]|nr:glycoside hydrolase [Planctomycetota bacterium]
MPTSRLSISPIFPVALIALIGPFQMACPPRCPAAGDPTQRQTIDLAGPWMLRLDPDDQGQRQRWFAESIGGEKLRLPGSLQAQGFGNPVRLDTPWTGGIADPSWFTEPRYEPYRQPDNIKVPFWLQPDRHYVGAAWYQRTVEIPEAWAKKRVTLILERCHWQTTVWVDQYEAGSQNSLSTPHVYDLTNCLSAGPHRMTIRVDNRLKIGVGINAHSVTDHTQTNWNGVIGRLELRATDPVWIDDVQVFPDRQRRMARVRIAIGNVTGKPVAGTLTMSATCEGSSSADDPAETTVPVDIERDATTCIEAPCPLGTNAPEWDEFQPALYRVRIQLRAETGSIGYADTKTVTFGMREVNSSGTQLTLNGRPVFLRGTLECCIFPLTGYPPTDSESWKRILERCRLHGLNHLRFHSWCPPEAAFIAADEMGFYYQVECGAWANQGSAIGDGQPIDQFIYDEQQRILRQYGNHPSFLMLAYGNEPAGRNQKQFLSQLVSHWKQTDPRRVYTGAAGWPILAENQYHNVPAPRIQAWGEGLRSRINARPPETVTDYRGFVQQHAVPVVSHEIGQWCVYPNFDEIPKYTGVLKPRNFEIFRDFLAAHHMADQARDFLMASGRLQTLCYKEEIESALRTPGFGGFQLLDLHDFPGQGTALVGILDPFWDSKPYVSPDEFRRFCNATVPLARLEKRVWSTDEDLAASIEVAHYGPHDLPNSVVSWRLNDKSGKGIGAGRLSPK